MSSGSQPRMAWLRSGLGRARDSLLGPIVPNSDRPDVAARRRAKWQAKLRLEIAANSQAFVVEMLGTFFFALIGSLCGPGLLEAALGNGFALAVAVYVSRPISGGHINPAVTLASLCGGRINIIKALGYWIFQVSGAIFASLAVAGLLGLGVGQTPVLGGAGVFAPPQSSISSSSLFGFEFLTTLLLVSTVYQVGFVDGDLPETSRSGPAGPLAIGLALAISALAIGSRTGACLNPARVIGPAVVFNSGWASSWSERGVWVYVISELLGGIAAGALYCA